MMQDTRALQLCQTAVSSFIFGLDKYDNVLSQRVVVKLFTHYLVI